MATSYEEGWRWHRDVHSGLITGDDGKARCLNQLHRHFILMPKDQWLASTGTDVESTRVCVAGASRVLAKCSDSCATGWREYDLESAFARVVTCYGTGKTCNPEGKKWAFARSQRAMKWLKELRK